MLAISLIFLVVYVFGAFAYGAAALLWTRQASPVWHPRRKEDVRNGMRLDHASFALFLVSTAWFVVHSVIEFRELAGIDEEGLIELVGLLLVFAFPPLIMHTVLLETYWDCDVEPGAWDRLAPRLMYVLSPLAAMVLVAMIFHVLPRPEPFGLWIGAAITSLFVSASLYSTVLMMRQGRVLNRSSMAGGNMRLAMLVLFTCMSVLMIAPFLTRQAFAASLIEHTVRASPLFFLVVSVYFESRFDFYDLVVKRATLLLASIVITGSALAVGLPLLEQLPHGMARPWLFAIALVPTAIAMPWVHAWLGRELDRLWFGREFTPVEAVKHVLAAMQPANDEASLVAATSVRLSEIVGAPIVILLDGYMAPDVQIANEVVAEGPSGERIRLAVLQKDGGRPLLSEDLTLLHSLAGVFGFMLENVRLQHKRQEQEQLAQALRLQSSRSELKALRAQINPHFFFNALNAIASLIHTDPARADAAVEQLAEVFRYTLRRSESEWAPLDQELAFARAYLDVEQARFGERLAVTIDADPRVLKAHVPSMLLQTLVENAVKHGISQVRGPGHIAIHANLDGEMVRLEVRDSGPGPSASPERPRRGDGESFGLRSVRDRLVGHFGGQAALTLERDAASHETVARIVMPLVAGDERARPRAHAS